MVKINEKNKAIYENMDRYMHGPLIGKMALSKTGDRKYFAGAIESMGEHWGLKHNELEGLADASMTSERGIQTAGMNYLQKYWDGDKGDNGANQLSVGDYVAHYKGNLDAYLKAKGIDPKEIDSIISKYATENLGKLKEKIAIIQHDLKSPDEKKREKADEDIKEYSNILEIFESIEDNIYQKLLPRAVEKTIASRLERLVKQKSSSKNEYRLVA